MTDTATAKPKKQSLKDIARRVSTIPPTSGDQKARPRTPLDSMRPVSVSAPPPPPADRMNELAVLCEATAERVRGDVSPQPAVPQQKRKSSLASALPVLGGIAVGLGAIALSVVVITRTGQDGTVAAQVVVVQPAEVAKEPANANAETAKAPELAKSPESEHDSAKSDEESATAAPPADGQHARPEKALAKGPEDKVGKVGDKSKDDAAEAPTAEPTEEPPVGLAGAMADAVGKGEKTANEGDAAKEAPAPAAGSVPTTPSQGQVQSALAAVRDAARGCVAGMDAPSRASVTFGSNGHVSGVSVSGAASGKPAASCIQSALSNARVPPFTKSSFTVGLSLRP